MAIVTYIKPSGAEIEASNNPQTKALAKKLGWKKKPATPVVTKPAETQIQLGDNNDWEGRRGH